MNAAVAPKTMAPTVTTKHLAYELAEQHQLAKKQGLEGGTGEDRRTWNSASARSCCPHRSQSNDRRALNAMYDFRARHGIAPKRGHGRHDADVTVIRWCLLIRA
jgi:hypothetical protein